MGTKEQKRNRNTQRNPKKRKKKIHRGRGNKTRHTKQWERKNRSGKGIFKEIQSRRRKYTGKRIKLDIRNTKNERIETQKEYSKQNKAKS